MNFIDFKNNLISFLFPEKCTCCGEIIHSGEGICRYCKSALKRVEEKRCLKCGMGVKFCECRFNVFRFEGIVAPFYNVGVARRGIYNAKFNSRVTAHNFFIKEMNDCTKKYYGEVEFDAVTFVPTSRKRLYERGYNQSEILAKGVAERLKVPLCDLLKTKGKHTRQHEVNNFKERFKNVNGVYFVKDKINFENVLLVDDIKTTGATLDECARCLKLAGAKNVYCITALVTNPRLKKGKNQV